MVNRQNNLLNTINKQKSKGENITLDINVEWQSYQKTVLNWLLDDNIDSVCWVASRQVGKSFLARTLALKVIEKRDTKVMLIYPSEKQAKYFMQEMLSMLGKQGDSIVVAKTKSQGNLQLTFKNGSIIYFRTDAPESLLGVTLDFVIFDEIGNIDPEAIALLLPTLDMRGGKILYCGTPKGHNHFFNIYLEHASEDTPNMRAIETRWNEFQHPIPELDRKRTSSILKKRGTASMSIPKWETEYNCSWTDHNSCFVGFQDIVNPYSWFNEPIEGEKYYMACDIGVIDDACVFTIGNEKGQVRYIHRFSNTNSVDITDSILALDEKWKPQVLLVETNGVGLPIYRTLEDKHNMSNLIGHHLGSDKYEMLSDLQYSIAEKELEIPDYKQLILELEGFAMETQGYGSVKYTSPYKDDCVMSLAYYNMIHKKYRGYGSYDWA